MTPRSRMIGYGSAAVFVVAGAACAVFVGGIVGELLVVGLISVGLVGAVALVFLEIGFGEERELAREAKDRRTRSRRALAMRRGSRQPRRGH